jgi:hypothetical protein
LVGVVFLRKKSKPIVFNKDMVNNIFGFGSGSEPFVFSSDDPVVIKEVKAMHPEIQGQWEFYYVKTCVSLVT